MIGLMITIVVDTSIVGTSQIQKILLDIIIDDLKDVTHLEASFEGLCDKTDQQKFLTFRNIMFAEYLKTD